MSRRTRAERWAGASAGRGPRAWWAERRMFSGASAGDARARDAVVQVARTPGHPLREPAKWWVAALWAETRDPALRQAVLDTDAVALRMPARLQTLALAGRLDEWEEHDARWAWKHLADADPDVRNRLADACRSATGSLLAALWDTDTGPGTPLRTLLLANPAPPPAEHLDALWDRWLEDPAEEPASALLRWRRPASDPRNAPVSVVAFETAAAVLREPPYRDALFDALLLHDHPLRDIAAKKITALRDRPLIEELCERARTQPELAEFCVRHRYAPEDPVRRVVFFLLTGQPEQRRALDPDGGLLSLAYLSAPGEERARIREAMPAVGELDLVRVLVGEDRRARILDLSEEEVGYLAEQLAERGRWADLWVIVQDLPVGTAVRLIRLFDGWVPSDEDARKIFEMYLETEPSAVEAAIREMHGDWPSVVGRARLLFTGRVNDVSFAPDAPLLAVASSSGAAGVFDLRTAGLVQRYEGFGSAVKSVLHTGNGTLIAGVRVGPGHPSGRVVRCANGSMRTLRKPARSVISLVPVGEDGGFAAATLSGELLLGAPSGSVESRPGAELGLDKGDRPRSLAAHRPSGRLAVLGESLLVVDTATGEATAVSGERAAQAAFIDANTLVCTDHHGTVTRLRRNATGWGRSARARFPGLFGLGTLARTGEPVVLDRGGGLRLLDPQTLATTDQRHPPFRRSPTSLVVSPGGDFFAIGDAAGDISLFDVRVREVPDLMRRPLAALVPRHLGIVGTALAEHGGGPEVEAALRLLHACLEHRFRFDVEIGDTVRLAAGEYDISL